MGIYIYLNVSKSVTQSEWEKVYAETLPLLQKFNFSEQRIVNIHDIETSCLVRTEETEVPENPYCSPRNRKTWTGWNTNGNYVILSSGEDYSLPRYLPPEDYDPDAGDAILAQIPAHLNYDWKDTRFNKVHYMWGNKTQGTANHIYLLAIACLLQARLGDKVYFYGDITPGQCKKAVEKANKYLETPIEMPDQCDMNRLYQRISKLDLSKSEKMILFNTLYLGTKDAEYGAFLRSVFSEELLKQYWTDQFRNRKVDTMGFTDLLYQYLSFGNSLDMLCHCVDFETEDDYKKFVISIMDRKLHLKEKDCSEIVRFHWEDEKSYTAHSLLEELIFAGAKNTKVDRFIPVEEIRTTLKSNLPAKYSVDEWIDDYLEREAHQPKIVIRKDMSEAQLLAAYTQDPVETFNQLASLKQSETENPEEKYDITKYEYLKFFETNDKIDPRLERRVIRNFRILENVREEMKETELNHLMEKDAHSLCKWIINNNRSILIRDKDWDKIFTNIETNKDSFIRYYPIFRVRMNCMDLVELVTALLINDDLYSHIMKLAAAEKNGYNNS